MLLFSFLGAQQLSWSVQPHFCMSTKDLHPPSFQDQPFNSWVFPAWLTSGSKFNPHQTKTRMRNYPGYQESCTRFKSDFTMCMFTSACFIFLLSQDRKAEPQRTENISVKWVAKDSQVIIPGLRASVAWLSHKLSVMHIKKVKQQHLLTENPLQQYFKK